MPITQTELDLTTDEYNVLKNSNQFASYSIDLYKWQPSFTDISGDADFFPDFDSIVWNDEVYTIGVFAARNTSGLIENFNPVASPKLGTALSLVTDDDNLYIYEITTTGISRATFDGTTWSNFSNILTNSNIVFIAATSPTRVHYIDYDSTHHYYRLKVLNFSGSWTSASSDIYWGYEINSFAAKRINSIDSLVIASDAPGIQSVKVIGTAIQKKLLPSGGIFCFTYKYGSWSDHYEIDKVDQWSSFRYRNRVRISSIGDKLWLTAYSSEGTVDTPITGYRIYSSGDGIHWSRGELFPLPIDSIEGFVILYLNNYLYACTYGQIYTSKSTLWFDNPHPDTKLSIEREILSLQIDRQDVQQLSFVVDNRRKWLDSTFFEGQETLAAIVKSGFGNLKIQIGIFELDTIDPINDLPENTVQFVGRDHFSWMMTKSQSEQFWNWMPQIIGVDEYIDSTGTGYGGMTYSAPAIGSFRAADGALQLASNNEEGVALNTWLTDNWNGSVESFTNLATLGNSEYIGIFCRTPDKDNGFFYYYNQSDDKLKLEFRSGGNAAVNLWTSGTKGWSGSLDGHFLMMVYRYCKFLLYSSDDPSGGGIEWFGEHEIIVNGQVSTIDPLLQSGYVGSFGYGFSDLSTSFDSIAYFPEGDLPSNYSRYITPSPSTPPTPNFTGPQAAFYFDMGCASDGRFLDRSIEGDYPIITWAWAFGDAGTSSSQNPTHTYGSAGTRNVTLTVTDSNGGSDSITQPVSTDTTFWSHDSDFTIDQDGWEIIEGTYSAGIGFVPVDPNLTSLIQIYRNFDDDFLISDYEVWFSHNHVAGSATQYIRTTLQTAQIVIDGSYNYTTDYEETRLMGHTFTSNNTGIAGRSDWNDLCSDPSTYEQALYASHVVYSGLGWDTITKVHAHGGGHNPFLS